MDQGRRRLLSATAIAASSAILPELRAEQPVRIGMGVAQTGALAGGGKVALLALRMWVEDVNARGGLRGRNVELIAYDDQSSPSTTPGIYAKLVDIDKVDLLIAPYGSVPTAPILPFVKERNLLLMGNFSFGVNKVQHNMFSNNGPWNSAASWSEGFFKLGQSAGVKTVAFLVADQEFAQNLAAGAKQLSAKHGFKTVYEQNYPPATVDFSAMIRAIRAAKPDMVYLMSYPNDSVAIVRAVNEIGVGDSVKILGGGMVGLQFASIMESLGSMLNGIVNFNTYVPERTMEFPGVKDFLARYAKRATEAKVDPLGFYLPPFNYAIGQILEQAIKATKSLDQRALADYLRKNELKTLVGGIRFDKDGDWANPRLLMIQFRGVTDKNIEQFRQAGKQVILDPIQLKTGELIQPFDKARK